MPIQTIGRKFGNEPRLDWSRSRKLALCSRCMAVRISATRPSRSALSPSTPASTALASFSRPTVSR